MKRIFISDNGSNLILVSKDQIFLWDTRIKDEWKVVYSHTQEITNIPSYDVVFYDNLLHGKGVKITCAFCTLMDTQMDKLDGKKLNKATSSTKTFDNTLHEITETDLDEYFSEPKFSESHLEGPEVIEVMNLDGLEMTPDSPRQSPRHHKESNAFKNPYLYIITIDVNLAHDRNQSTKTDVSCIKVKKTPDSPSECLVRWDRDGALIAAVVNSPEPEMYFYTPFQSLSICVNIFQKDETVREIRDPIKDFAWTNDSLFIILVNIKGQISVVSRLGDAVWLYSSDKHTIMYSTEFDRGAYCLSIHPSQPRMLISNGTKVSFFALPSLDIITLLYSYTKSEIWTSSVFNIKKSPDMPMTLWRMAFSTPSLESHSNYEGAIDNLQECIADHATTLNEVEMIELFQSIFESISWSFSSTSLLHLIPHFVSLLSKIFDAVLEKHGNLDLMIQLAQKSEDAINTLIKDSFKKFKVSNQIMRPHLHLFEIWSKIVQSLEQKLEETIKKSKMSNLAYLEAIVYKLKQKSESLISFESYYRSIKMDDNKVASLRKGCASFYHGKFVDANTKFGKENKKSFINASFLSLLLSYDIIKVFDWLNTKYKVNVNATLEDIKSIVIDLTYHDVVASIAKVFELAYDKSQIGVLSPIFCFENPADLVAKLEEAPSGFKGYYFPLETEKMSNSIKLFMQHVNLKGSIINAAITLYLAIGHTEHAVRLLLKYNLAHKLLTMSYFVQEKPSTIKTFKDQLETTHDIANMRKIIIASDAISPSIRMKKILISKFLENIQMQLQLPNYSHGGRKNASELFYALQTALNYFGRDTFKRFVLDHSDENLMEFKTVCRYLWNLHLVELYKSLQVPVKFIFKPKEPKTSKTTKVLDVVAQLLCFSDLHSPEIIQGMFLSQVSRLDDVDLMVNYMEKFLPVETMVVDANRVQYSEIKTQIRKRHSQRVLDGLKAKKTEWMYETDENFLEYISSCFGDEVPNFEQFISTVHTIRSIDFFVPTLSREEIEKTFLKDIPNFCLISLPKYEENQPILLSKDTSHTTVKRKENAFSKVFSVFKPSVDTDEKKGFLGTFWKKKEDPEEDFVQIKSPKSKKSDGDDIEVVTSIPIKKNSEPHIKLVPEVLVKKSSGDVERRDSEKTKLGSFMERRMSQRAKSGSFHVTNIEKMESLGDIAPLTKQERKISEIMDIRSKSKEFKKPDGEKKKPDIPKLKLDFTPPKTTPEHTSTHRHDDADLEEMEI